MKVIFHPEASDEMLESARFFDEKCAGLGSDLITAIQESTRRILQFPQSGPIEKWNIRKCLVRGFPFTLLMRPPRIRSSLSQLCISIAGRVTGQGA